MCNIEELYYDIFGWAKAHEDLLGKTLSLPGGVTFIRLRLKTRLAYCLASALRRLPKAPMLSDRLT